jgi:hypothetical protein
LLSLLGERGRRGEATRTIFLPYDDGLLCIFDSLYKVEILLWLWLRLMSSFCFWLITRKKDARAHTGRAAVTSTSNAAVARRAW